MRLQWPWPPNISARNIRGAHRLARSKAKGGGAEPWNFAGLRNSGYFQCVRECGGKRFVDEYRFTASRGLPELVEVNSSVHALQQNSINQWTEIANLADELDVPFVFEFGAKFFDPIPTIGYANTKRAKRSSISSCPKIIVTSLSSIARQP